MTARIDSGTNEILVRTSGLGRLTIWLGYTARGASMVNFAAPLTVRVNLVPVWNNRKVTPSLAVLLEDLYQRGDRHNLFVAKVDLNLK
jgi:hypothetical protein